MLVTKLAEQPLRPKRIGSLTLPLAAFGDRSNEALGIANQHHDNVFDNIVAVGEI